ncbi:hypothetical protein GPECTOR_4g981 [Gonium pectorale]|uniref:Uncharacterized protein n=1 Tax=Gonium pectorale TaxID=33097 RepID=A0A150GYI4_GONPE|nr:hypothetical protein GPECTOR_4g981 [Gonium pectorale]|eukprot:KXZ54909.1 hypothetical protein GPECTOR_4g981 [Gonium pectorale]
MGPKGFINYLATGTSSPVRCLSFLSFNTQALDASVVTKAVTELPGLRELHIPYSKLSEGPELRGMFATLARLRSLVKLTLCNDANLTGIDAMDASTSLRHLHIKDPAGLGDQFLRQNMLKELQRLKSLRTLELEQCCIDNGACSGRSQGPASSSGLGGDGGGSPLQQLIQSARESSLQRLLINECLSSSTPHVFSATFAFDKGRLASVTTCTGRNAPSIHLSGLNRMAEIVLSGLAPEDMFESLSVPSLVIDDGSIASAPGGLRHLWSLRKHARGAELGSLLFDEAASGGGGDVGAGRSFEAALETANGVIGVLGQPRSFGFLTSARAVCSEDRDSSGVLLEINARQLSPAKSSANAGAAWPATPSPRRPPPSHHSSNRSGIAADAAGPVADTPAAVQPRPARSIFSSGLPRPRLSAAEALELVLEGSVTHGLDLGGAMYGNIQLTLLLQQDASADVQISGLRVSQLLPSATAKLVAFDPTSKQGTEVLVGSTAADPPPCTTAQNAGGDNWSLGLEIQKSFLTGVTEVLQRDWDEQAGAQGGERRSAVTKEALRWVLAVRDDLVHLLPPAIVASRPESAPGTRQVDE